MKHKTVIILFKYASLLLTGLLQGETSAEVLLLRGRSASLYQQPPGSKSAIGAPPYATLAPTQQWLCDNFTGINMTTCVQTHSSFFTCLSGGSHDRCQPFAATPNRSSRCLLIEIGSAQYYYSPYRISQFSMLQIESPHPA